MRSTKTYLMITLAEATNYDTTPDDYCNHGEPCWNTYVDNNGICYEMSEHFGPGDFDLCSQ